MKGYKTFGAILGILVLTTAFLAFMSSFSVMTSAANVTDVNTSSTANVTAYIAIGMSTNLSNGVHFGVVEPSSDNNNATGNYNATDSMTQYWIAVSSDGNVNVTLDIKDDAPLTSGANTIPNLGYTYDSSETNSDSLPADGIAITTGFFESEANVAPGENAYFRFWLDVPAGQAAGNYQNTVLFQAAAI